MADLYTAIRPAVEAGVARAATSQARAERAADGSDKTIALTLMGLPNVVGTCRLPPTRSCSTSRPLSCCPVCSDPLSDLKWSSHRMHFHSMNRLDPFRYCTQPPDHLSCGGQLLFLRTGSALNWAVDVQVIRVMMTAVVN